MDFEKFKEERKKQASIEVYGALMGNMLYYEECVEVLEKMAKEFQQKIDQYKLRPD
jgi:hypothetical protein